MHSYQCNAVRGWWVTMSRFISFDLLIYGTTQSHKQFLYTSSLSMHGRARRPALDRKTAGSHAQSKLIAPDTKLAITL